MYLVCSMPSCDRDSRPIVQYMLIKNGVGKLNPLALVVQWTSNFPKNS